MRQPRFSKQELLWKFRKEYRGPVVRKPKERLWSKARPKVVILKDERGDFNAVEYFMFKMEPWEPEFPKLNQEFMDMFRRPWNGEFLVPCSYVRVDEVGQKLLAKEREEFVNRHKTAYEAKGAK